MSKYSRLVKLVKLVMLVMYVGFFPKRRSFNLLENSQFGAFFDDLSNKPGSNICDVIVVKPEDTNIKI